MRGSGGEDQGDLDGHGITYDDDDSRTRDSYDSLNDLSRNHHGGHPHDRHHGSGTETDNSRRSSPVVAVDDDMDGQEDLDVDDHDDERQDELDVVGDSMPASNKNNGSNGTSASSGPAASLSIGGDHSAFSKFK